MKEISSKSVFYTVFGIIPALMLGALVFAACLQPVDPQDFIKAMTGTGFDANIRTTAELEEAIAGQPGNLKYGTEWKLANGTYNVQLDIHTNITVRGESRTGVIIQGPDDYTTLTIKGFESDDIWVKAYYISYNYTYTPTSATSAAENEKTYITGLVTIRDCTATVKNLTVKGVNARFTAADTTRPFATSHPGRRVLCSGIGIGSAEATIEGVTVDGILGVTSTTNTYGIVAARNQGNTSRNLAVTDCTIQGFQKNGAHILSGVAKVTFTGNTVIGADGNLPPAQNGITIECLHADISGNKFQSLKHDDASAVATGVNITITPAQAALSDFNQLFLTLALSSNTFNVANAWADSETGIFTAFPGNEWSVYNKNTAPYKDGITPLSSKVYYFFDDKDWDWPS
ncbi:MAG: hypothetical protein LBH43_03900 [Treponema sp.]|jgi:hypothetical protein|nr:hypothetical protein [Treponema sp.]